METLRKPRAEIERYDVECSNEECLALIRCKKSDLTVVSPYQPMGREDTCDYWVMKCPHCDRTTSVDFFKTRVLEGFT